MRLLRIDFVEGENRFPGTFRKTFQLCFNKNSKGFTYSGCFCWQDYPKCFIKSNNKIVKVYEAIRAPTIIVTRQDTFSKTLTSLIHELGHYVIWLLFYWKKPRKLEEKIEVKNQPKLYGFFSEWYDCFFAREMPEDKSAKSG